MSVSVIIPVYNEEENVPLLADELAQLSGSLADLEVLLVDDGSTDGTWAAITRAAETHPVIHGLRSPRNAGQSSAMLHGLHAAAGEICVTLDGDLQNNPADIPKLVEGMGEHDAVCGYRANRRDTWSRRVASRVANKVRNWVTHDGMRDTGCSLKAFRKSCVTDLPYLDGVHRFMPAYFRLHGRTITEVPVDHRPRQHGESKYTNLKRLPRGILDLFGFWWYRKRYLARLEMTRSS